MRPILIALILKTCLAIAQDTTLIVPNGKTIQGRVIKPYTKDFEMYRVKDGVEEIFGTLSDNYRVFKSGNNEFGLRIVNIKTKSLEILDSGYVNAETLQPIYHRSHQTNKTILLDFESNKISGVVKSGTDKEIVSKTYPFSFFDSYFENYIATCVPLKNGFTFKFAEFIDSKIGMVWSSGAISEFSSSSLKGKIWLVKLYEKGRGRRTTFWIDQDRQLLQWEYNFNGSISRTRLKGLDRI